MSSAKMTSPAPTEVSSGAITATGRWMALMAALLGWLFDGAEMGLFSMVGRAAMQDLLGFGTSRSEEHV